MHKLAYGLITRLRQREDAWNSLVSGALSGLPLLFQTKGCVPLYVSFSTTSSRVNSFLPPPIDALHSPENRRTPALYLLTRLAQCVYNELKRRNMYVIKHLFTLSSFCSLPPPQSRSEAEESFRCFPGVAGGTSGAATGLTGTPSSSSSPPLRYPPPQF